MQKKNLALTRSAAAPRPPHIATLGSHTSCGRFAASTYSKAWHSHKLRLLRSFRTYQSLAFTGCGRLAASAHDKAWHSRKLRPLCGFRTVQSLALTQAAAALLWHQLQPLRGLRPQRRFAFTRAAAALQPLLTATLCTHTRLRPLCVCLQQRLAEQ